MSKKFLISRQRHLLLTFLISLIVSALLAVTIGSFKISVFDILLGKLDELSSTILYTIRMPRVMLAAFVGASLAISGACLQGLFRNPLADPGLIGVSAGAALGAAFAIVFSSRFISLDFLGPYLIPFSAIIGSASVIIILFVITKGFGYDGVTYMLLAGIAVNAIAGVGIGVLTYISDDSELRSLTFWTMGSFGGVTWPLIMPAIVVILFSIVWIIGLSRKLDLIQLGDVEASRLGINIKKVRFGVIISSAVVVGISVALSGMIGFVGLVVPHLVLSLIHI